MASRNAANEELLERLLLDRESRVARVASGQQPQRQVGRQEPAKTSTHKVARESTTSTEAPSAEARGAEHLGNEGVRKLIWELSAKFDVPPSRRFQDTTDPEPDPNDTSPLAHLQRAMRQQDPATLQRALEAAIGRVETPVREKGWETLVLLERKCASEAVLMLAMTCRSELPKALATAEREGGDPALLQAARQAVAQDRQEAEAKQKLQQTCENVRKWGSPPLREALDAAKSANVDPEVCAKAAAVLRDEELREEMTKAITARDWDRTEELVVKWEAAGASDDVLMDALRLKLRVELEEACRLYDMDYMRVTLQEAKEAGVDEKDLEASRALLAKMEMHCAALERARARPCVDGLRAAVKAADEAGVVSVRLDAAKKALSALVELAEACEQGDLEVLREALMHAEASGVHPEAVQEGKDILHREEQYRKRMAAVEKKFLAACDGADPLTKGASKTLERALKEAQAAGLCITRKLVQEATSRVLRSQFRGKTTEDILVMLEAWHNNRAIDPRQLRALLEAASQTKTKPAVLKAGKDVLEKGKVAARKALLEAYEVRGVARLQKLQEALEKAEAWEVEQNELEDCRAAVAKERRAKVARTSLAEAIKVLNLVRIRAALAEAEAAGVEVEVLIEATGVLVREERKAAARRDLQEAVSCTSDLNKTDKTTDNDTAKADADEGVGMGAGRKQSRLLVRLRAVLEEAEDAGLGEPEMEPARAAAALEEIREDLHNTIHEVRQGKLPVPLSKLKKAVAKAQAVDMCDPELDKAKLVLSAGMNMMKAEDSLEMALANTDLWKLRAAIAAAKQEGLRTLSTQATQIAFEHRLAAGKARAWLRFACRAREVGPLRRALSRCRECGFAAGDLNEGRAALAEAAELTKVRFELSSAVLKRQREGLERALGMAAGLPVKWLAGILERAQQLLVEMKTRGKSARRRSRRRQQESRAAGRSSLSAEDLRCEVQQTMAAIAEEIRQDAREAAAQRGGRGHPTTPGKQKVLSPGKQKALDTLVADERLASAAAATAARCSGRGETAAAPSILERPGAAGPRRPEVDFGARAALYRLATEVGCSDGGALKPVKGSRAELATAAIVKGDRRAAAALGVAEEPEVMLGVRTSQDSYQRADARDILPKMKDQAPSLGVVMNPDSYECVPAQSAFDVIMKKAIPEETLAALTLLLRGYCLQDAPTMAAALGCLANDDEKKRIPAAMKEQHLLTQLVRELPSHPENITAIVDAVEIVLSLGCNTEVRNELWETPLIAATRALVASSQISAEHRYAMSVIELLLESGADPNAGDMHGETALMEAALCGSSELCRVLLHSQADPLRRSRSGITALDLAERVYPDITRLLEAAENASSPQ